MALLANPRTNHTSSRSRLVVRWWRGLSLLLLVSVLVLGLEGRGSHQASPSPSAPVELTRDQVVSYFLFNCLRFGSWPADSDPHSAKSVRMGILGKSKLGSALETVSLEARSRWFAGGKVEVLHAQDPGKLLSCQIIFIDEMPPPQLAAALEQYKGLPVLLVSDRSGFLEAGGVLEIQIQRGAFTFHLNLDQLTLRGTDLASKMKDLAVTILKDGKREPNPRRRNAP